jgi:hypothetical protein
MSYLRNPSGDVYSSYDELLLNACDAFGGDGASQARAKSLQLYQLFTREEVRGFIDIMPNDILIDSLVRVGDQCMVECLSSEGKKALLHELCSGNRGDDCSISTLRVLIDIMNEGELSEGEKQMIRDQYMDLCLSSAEYDEEDVFYLHMIVLGIKEDRPDLMDDKLNGFLETHCDVEKFCNALSIEQMRKMMSEAAVVSEYYIKDIDRHYVMRKSDESPSIGM